MHPVKIWKMIKMEALRNIYKSIAQTEKMAVWWRAICSYCVSRLDRHVTYYSPHMLYICRY
jgi:hypothetical protein